MTSTEVSSARLARCPKSIRERRELIDRMEYVESPLGGGELYRVTWNGRYYYARDTYTLAEKVLWHMKNNPSII